MKRMLLFACVFACTSALAQAPDIVLVNGRIATLDAKATVAEALAIRDGRILAVGNFAKVRPLIARSTRVIDLHGRTVIPGLIDSHMHAIRAALSFSTEVNWIGTKSIAEALSRLREVAKTHKPGDWLIVAGGWTPEQFAEKRRPTAEYERDTFIYGKDKLVEKIDKRIDVSVRETKEVQEFKKTPGLKHNMLYDKTQPNKLEKGKH